MKQRTPEFSTELRRAVVTNTYGSLQEQQDNLVKEILSRFENPDKWPMTDGERIEFLRTIYRMASTIKKTKSL